MSQPAAPGADRPEITAVVFDIGGVLVDWDPRYLYRQLLDTDDEIAAFLQEVEFDRWNHEVDAGRLTWAAAVDGIAQAHPHREDLIAAYPARFGETMSGPIEGTVEVLAELHAQGVRLLALTNWAADTFLVARERFAFLGLFEDIVVSADEGHAKPEPEIFQALVRRHGLEPARTLFIDDRRSNVDAAQDAGLVGLVFTDPAALRADLDAAGVLARRA
jgi:2-haloacid dehalogenase